ncbi:hypothetical protein NHQ30_009362 [Ciborinia camelliae]|nr:hypothetical protein NHQ30_009362 [Ciborinia camelliae]
MAEEESWKYFNSIPWCSKLLQNSDYILVPEYSSIVKPDTEDSLFTETLKTSNNIRETISLYKKPTSDSHTDEVRRLISLGDGMNGKAHMLHGGIAAVLMDDSMGMLMLLSRMSPATRTAVTAGLNISYKKFIQTPQIIMVAARLRETMGRKFYIDSWIENAEGTVLTTGEGLWIRFKEKL